MTLAPSLYPFFLGGHATAAGPPVEPPSAAADLRSSLYTALAADGTLETVIGRPAEGEDGWLWYEDDPPGSDVPLPIVVLDEDEPGAAEPPSYDGETTQPVTVRISVWAETRARATSVARAVMTRLGLIDDEDDGPAEIPPLEWSDGLEVTRRVGRADPERIRGERDPSGRPAAGARVRVEFLTQFNVYAEDDGG